VYFPYSLPLILGKAKKPQHCSRVFTAPSKHPYCFVAEEKVMIHSLMRVRLFVPCNELSFICVQHK
jgi:hypothetical protein